MTTATTTAYTVSGMTCGGCVRKVRGAISEIDGVTGVDVQFKDRRVVVTSSTPIDPAVVQAAVADAGYTATADTTTADTQTADNANNTTPQEVAS